MTARVDRRRFCQVVAGGAAASALGASRLTRAADELQLRYILGSCMYGITPLAEILPEAAKTGADAIDIWPKIHGDQREQIEAMGHDAFAALLEQHQARLGILTRYDLGPYKLET